MGSFPAARVLVLTTRVDPGLVRLSLDAGASAVLDKDGDPATVLAGIRTSLALLARRSRA